MILSKAYDEIMDRIVVNDDMRRRVLQNAVSYTHLTLPTTLGV